MSESLGVIGLGIQCKIGDGASPEVFTLIGECGDFDGPEVSNEFEDMTHQQSTGGFRERKATFKSSGNVTFSCAWLEDDAGQTALITAARAVPAALKNFTLDYPNHKRISFAAYPSVRYSTPMGRKMTMNVTLALEGNYEVTDIT
jgi:hypothetical protein